MYNIDVLGEVHFWRHYLSRGAPRIIMSFGRQSLIIGTGLLATEVSYPEIPEDTNKYMKMMYDDDLLSLADYKKAVEFEDDDALSIDEGTIAESGYDDEVD